MLPYGDSKQANQVSAIFDHQGQVALKSLIVLYDVEIVRLYRVTKTIVTDKFSRFISRFQHTF